MPAGTRGKANIGHPYKPTPEQTKQVEWLAGVGLTHKQIGDIIGISDNTLRNHFRGALDIGEAQATAKVAGKLYEKAMSGDTACMIFWLKARAKWSEKPPEEDTGGIKVTVTGGLPS